MAKRQRDYRQEYAHRVARGAQKGLSRSAARGHRRGYWRAVVGGGPRSGVMDDPAERMKAKKEHRVPLTGKVVEILRALPREADYVFPGGRKGTPISNMAMAELLKRMGRDDITVHGFRSAFRDWAAERTNYANHVVEMSLAHVIGDKVEAAYRRGDLFAKRARLMADWMKFCATKLDGASNVVTPTRART
jgi:integrase